MSEFNVGDRVRVARINWDDATEDEKAVVGQEGVVVHWKPDGNRAISLFVRVVLDNRPVWWTHEYGIPFVEDELEKL